MNKEELIQRLTNVAENYKKDYLEQSGVVMDIKALINDYTESLINNLSKSIKEDLVKQKTENNNTDNISTGDVIMAFLEWLQSDDCWVQDKKGNKIDDVEINGKDFMKYINNHLIKQVS